MSLSYILETTTSKSKGPDDNLVWFVGHPGTQEHIFDFSWEVLESATISWGDGAERREAKKNCPRTISQKSKEDQWKVALGQLIISFPSSLALERPQGALSYSDKKLWKPLHACYVDMGKITMEAWWGSSPTWKKCCQIPWNRFFRSNETGVIDLCIWLQSNKEKNPSKLQ